MEHSRQLYAVSFFGAADWGPIGVRVRKRTRVDGRDVVAEAVIALEHLSQKERVSNNLIAPGAGSLSFDMSGQMSGSFVAEVNMVPQIYCTNFIP
jgi:hypothetical protein